MEEKEGVWGLGRAREGGLEWRTHGDGGEGKKQRDRLAWGEIRAIDFRVLKDWGREILRRRECGNRDGVGFWGLLLVIQRETKRTKRLAVFEWRDNFSSLSCDYWMIRRRLCVYIIIIIIIIIIIFLNKYKINILWNSTSFFFFLFNNKVYES